MKKIMLLVSSLVIISTSLYAKKVEQTICFSKSSCSDKYAYGSLGDKLQLCGGKCQGRTLSQMNQKGWKLKQVVSGLNSSFGMVFEK